jgi:hypothetical protein
MSQPARLQMEQLHELARLSCSVTVTSKRTSPQWHEPEYVVILDMASSLPELARRQVLVLQKCARLRQWLDG